ncbi:hypothetical protein [Niallia taxi]|uniref:hypothetical protein n=1 Tax=Niallia taxi TaxID=2499688 RepID=UPI0015F5A54D|nr:hypothetical protein [Niallia taxi]
MILEWTWVDDKDIAASNENFVFRLRNVREKHKRTYTEDTIRVINLQVRKKQNTDFRDLGYRFLIDETVDKSMYVDEIVWTDIDEIAVRAEDVLVSLGYIEEARKPFKQSDIEVLRAVTIGSVKALKARGLLKPLEDYQESFLEDMILRLISFWESKLPFEVSGESEIQRKIRLKELELEICTLMNEPDIYFTGGWADTFYGQSFLHDEEWLEDLIKEEEEEAKESKV